MLERLNIYGKGRGFILVEHYPLGCSGNAVMALVEGRQASQNGIIVVSHDCCLFLLELLGARMGGFK